MQGASASAWIGPSPHIHENSSPRTASTATRLTNRDMRHRVYGFILLICRSQPPNTFFCQNWLYPLECSEMRLWIWRITSRPARINTHHLARSWSRSASSHVINGMSVF